jgi:hypothetical protein
VADAVRDQLLSGFLVVKRFDALYREFAAKPKFVRDIYALPVADTAPDRAPVTYRGMDRDAIKPSQGSDGTLPAIRMAELNRAMLEDPAFRFDGQEDFLVDERDARDVLRWAEEETPGEYELIWARTAGAPPVPPSGYECLGYEPTTFVSDHFSPLCDCMCFPRWHGTDREGVLFIDHFERLNASGLFDDPAAAATFVTYYASFEWTEQGDYLVAEVWAPLSPLAP